MVAAALRRVCTISAWGFAFCRHTTSILFPSGLSNYCADANNAPVVTQTLFRSCPVQQNTRHELRADTTNAQDQRLIRRDVWEWYESNGADIARVVILYDKTRSTRKAWSRRRGVVSCVYRIRNLTLLCVLPATSAHSASHSTTVLLTAMTACP